MAAKYSECPHCGRRGVFTPVPRHIPGLGGTFEFPPRCRFCGHGSLGKKGFQGVLATKRATPLNLCPVGQREKILEYWRSD